MKRSEMIKLIADRLRGPFTHGDNWKEDEILDYAHVILMDIEGVGMLPPSNYEEVLRDPYADGYIVYRKFENAIIDRPNYKITDFWEPEDD